MNRLVLIRFGILLALSLVGQPALAQAMQDYQYQPNRIYEIRTGLGITTQIELDPNDEVKDYSTGFSSGWELNRRDNVFYLKPKNVDVDTNMMVRTAKRAYIFELKVVATDPGSLRDVQAVARQTGNELVEQQQEGEEIIHVLRRR